MNQSEALLVDNTGGKRLTSPSENTLLCKEKPREKLVFVKLGFMGRKNNTRGEKNAVLSELNNILGHIWSKLCPTLLLITAATKD